jgi:hypothetical protein
MVDCPRKGKLVRGCRWEGRYDHRGPSQALEHALGRAWSFKGNAAPYEVRDTYVRDVCRTCGAVRERGK